MIRVIETGRNPTMRHLGRVHNVDIAWLHERFQEPSYGLDYCLTDRMRADLFTKAYTNQDKWKHAVSLINVVDYEEWFNHPVPATGGGLAVDLI